MAIPPVDEHYPWTAVRDGLARLGFKVLVGLHIDADFLVTWSPWNGSRRQILQNNFKGAGKPVIIMENGWLSPIGDRLFYQVALDGWNGTGRFPSAGPERWRSWRIAEYPWRERRTGHALVIGQRGHPNDARTAPPGWHETLPAGALPMIRRHRNATRPLSADLAGAAEVHVWTSNAASHAVMAGVPVVQHGPNLMVSALASRPGMPLYRGDRGLVLENLAWAQWRIDEILLGEPFARLLATCG